MLSVLDYYDVHKIIDNSGTTFDTVHTYMRIHIDEDTYMSLPHLLLGLLNASPMSGYDLNKVFNTTIQHFWTTDQSQIYRTLYKLEEEGKVRVETIIQEDNPNKKVYHVTEVGAAELRQWLSKPLHETPIRE